MIGFCSDEEENRGAICIESGPEFNGWPCEARIDSIEKVHRWSS